LLGQVRTVRTVSALSDGIRPEWRAPCTYEMSNFEDRASLHLTSLLIVMYRSHQEDWVKPSIWQGNEKSPLNVELKCNAMLEDLWHFTSPGELGFCAGKHAYG